MKIALLEPIGISQEKIDEYSKPIIEMGHDFVYYDTKTTDPTELKRRSLGCEMVMIANNPFPDNVIRELPELKAINVAFTGIDHVGLDACRDNGIAVFNAAGYSDQAVAELAVGMTINLFRMLQECDTAVRNQKTSAGLMGIEIGGKTVGIIGTGKIGLLTAKMFKAFGARVIAYSRTERKEGKELGIEYMPLAEVMKKSDIVSLHIPNNAETKGMISSEMISLMKPSAVMINCARGPVLDNTALARALKEHRIAGAAIDVYNCEPPIPAEEPLLDAPNTLLTPHVGFLTRESMERRAKIVFENTLAYLNGTPQNVCRL